MTAPLFAESEWNFAALDRVLKAVEEVALGDLKLDVYPNQIEIITAEQMLDAYASTGMPIFYQHWSFGKHFTQQELLYRKGMQGLAYEIVINSNPCISYLMEENTMAMQALVIAHAAYGHNSFFKGNYLFRQWTNADAIVDYLIFARNYLQNQFATIDIAPRPAMSSAAFRAIRGWRRKNLEDMIPGTNGGQQFVAASYCSTIKSRVSLLS